MIYDCFAFFNELDLLEIRLNELDSVVDKFVLVEATRTFQKQPKPLYYEENKERFKNFKDKIIHIVVDDYPNFFSRFRVPTAMDYDNHQKNQITRGLKNIKPDDIIIYSDLDEIPRAEKIIQYKDQPGIKVFQQILCSYFINCISTHGPVNPCELNTKGIHYWRGSVMANFSEFKNTKLFRKLRDIQSDSTIQIEDGGWHFSYLGDSEKILQKLNSWTHSKDKGTKDHISKLQDQKVLEDIIAKGKDLFGRDYVYEFVKLDEKFPKYLVKNKNKFPHLIKNM